MTRLGYVFLIGALPLWLGACAPSSPPVIAPSTGSDLSGEILTTEPSDTEAQCHHSEMRPALYETITEQEILRPEIKAADGSVAQPASLRSVTRQSQLRPRQEIWFRIPCPEDMGQADVFAASLQRALKARGLYTGEVNGVMDGATRQAVVHYQASLGLQSETLALASARRLGLIAVR